MFSSHLYDRLIKNDAGIGGIRKKCKNKADVRLLFDAARLFLETEL